MADQRLDQKTSQTTVADTDIMLVCNPSTGAMKKATVNKIRLGNIAVTLTDGATITWNFSLGNSAKVTLGGNRTLSITNPVAQCVGILHVTQDGTGSRTLNLPGFEEGGGITLSTGANHEDVLAFHYDGTNFYWFGSNFGATVGGGGGGFDADAQAYITAASIVNSTQQNAVNQLVLDIKAASIWTKMKAVYPFLGGTSGTHKWNLKDPRDLDAAFRLVFQGTFTHSANGIIPNGTDAYAETKLVPNTHFAANLAHMSYYSRDTGSASGLIMGSLTTGGGSADATFLGPNFTPDLSAMGSTAVSSTAFSNTSRLLVISREGTTQFKDYRDGALINTASSTWNGWPTDAIYLCARNLAGSADNFTAYGCSFASIGADLSAAEITALNTAVNTFQTALSRNV